MARVEANTDQLAVRALADLFHEEVAVRRAATHHGWDRGSERMESPEHDQPHCD